MWHQQALLGDPGALQPCSLKLIDSNQKVAAVYALDNAWPSKVEIAGLKAGASEVVMMTVEIVCDTILLNP
jgi:T4-like virus tail tube protein gp19